MQPLFSYLSPENWPFNLALLPDSACLVGGAVRDALLGRNSQRLDLDFVMPLEAVKTARKIAKIYQAGFVLLDSDRQIARVVFKDCTVDFAQQEGENLETDLQRRDYTINAIAYNPYTQKFIDPLQGCKDIEARLIRMVSRQNLEDDPLRVLRGYRQAAQLNFTIENNTRDAIRDCAYLLNNIASERIHNEISYLLNNLQGVPWLIAAWEDGVLNQVFQIDITATGIKQLVKVGENAKIIWENWPQLQTDLSAEIRGINPLSWLAIAKLTSLLSPGTEKTELNTDWLKELKYARGEIRGINALLQYLPQMRSAAAIAEFSLREQFFCFRTLGEGFPALVLLSLALDTPLESIAPLVDRYLNPNDQVAHPTPLINGQELMQALQLPSSPLVGWLLTQIQIARIENKIATVSEALELAAELMASYPG